MRRRLLGVGLTLLATVLAAGCDLGRVETAPEAEAERPRILSEDELLRSLITAEMIGASFREDRDDPDLSETGPGCLRAFDAVHRTSFPVREKVAIIRPRKAPFLPSVLSVAATFSSAADARTALPGMRKELGACTKVDETEDGARVRLTLTRDDRRFDDTVDDQFNVIASGTVTARNRSASLLVGFSAIQVDSNVVITGYITPSDADSLEEEMQTLNRAAVDRLTAVVSREPVPDDPLPGFRPMSGGSDPADA